MVLKQQLKQNEQRHKIMRKIIASEFHVRKIMNSKPNMKTTTFVLSILLSMLLAGVVSGQQKPTTGYAPVGGLKMYYEVHGSGDPVVLLHGAFMAISGDWNDWIGELSKTRKVIAIEMQGHGRTADIKRDLSYENLSDDVAGLLDYLKIPSADIIGYSLGGGVAKCERSSAFQPRSAATVGSRKRTTFGRHSRGKYSRALPWKLNIRG